MKITIDSEVVRGAGFTMQDFSVILYYLSGGTGVLNEKLCESLWEDGFLKKTSEGYAFHEGKLSKIRTWIVKSSVSADSLDRVTRLAKEMQEVFPEGKKDGKYYWRDSTKIIAQRLVSFIKKFGDYEDEEFIEATKAYVKSFNGDYSFMQLLKYFIYKRDNNSGEVNSQLSSYIENLGEGDTLDNDWTTKLV